MRSAVVVAALGLISHTHFASAAECKSNPLFAPLYAMLNFTAPPHTATGSASSFCPRYSGQPSCCSSKMDSTVKAALSVASSKLGDYQSTAQDVDAEDVVEAIKTLKADFPKEFAEVPDVPVEAVEPFMSAVKGVIQPMFNCVRGVYAEVRGMLCLACEPDWDKYYDPDPAPGTLTLATATCDGLYGACKGFVKAVNSAKNDAIDIAIGLAKKAGTEVPSQYVSEAKSLDVCEYAFSQIGSSCKDGICTYLGDPLSLLAVTPPKPPPGALASHAKFVRALSASDDGAARSAVAETFASIVLDAHRSLRGAAAGRVAVAAENDKPVAPNVVYSSDGFPAYSAGCSVQVQKDVNCDGISGGNGGAFSSVGGVLGFVGILAGAVVGVTLITVVAVVVVRRNKNRADNGAYQHFNNQQPAPNAYYAPPSQVQP